MTENEIAKEVVDAAYQIHTKLGPGLFEIVYEVILLLINFAEELIKNGITRVVNGLQE